MKIFEKIRAALTEEESPEEIRKQKKEQINNLTEGNDFMNEQVNKIFDLLDD